MLDTGAMNDELNEVMRIQARNTLTRSRQRAHGDLVAMMAEVVAASDAELAVIATGMTLPARLREGTADVGVVDELLRAVMEAAVHYRAGQGETARETILRCLHSLSNGLADVVGRELIPEVAETETVVETIEWRGTVVACRDCRATGPWTLWTRLDPDGNPDAGAVCGSCGLDQHHAVVYPDYVRARAGRIAAGTDADEPRLEVTIGWRPHHPASLDLAEWDSTAIARVTWRPI